MKPTWYHLLGVTPDATTEEIRAAWKASIADLDPGDHRFASRSEAARVLLDPEQRAAYDASLAEDDTPPAPEADRPPAQPDAGSAPRRGSAPEIEPGSGPNAASEIEPELGPNAVSGIEPESTSESGPDAAGRRRRPVPTWIMAALAVLAVAMVALTGYVWQSDAGAGGSNPTDEVSREAQAAAEQAVVPVISYGYQTLDEDQAEAQQHLTEEYRKDYDKLFAVIEENAPETETTVGANVIASGIVRGGENRVDVLVFVDRPTTNRLNPEPIVYQDQVTLTMVREGERWLVDNMVTSPAQP